MFKAKVLGEDRYVVGWYLKNYVCKKEDRNITRYSHVIFEEEGYGASFVEIDENTLILELNGDQIKLEKGGDFGKR